MGPGTAEPEDEDFEPENFEDFSEGFAIDDTSDEIFKDEPIDFDDFPDDFDDDDDDDDI